MSEKNETQVSILAACLKKDRKRRYGNVLVEVEKYICPLVAA